MKINYRDIIKDQLEVADERLPEYGSATDNFINISNILKTSWGLDISPIEICKVMISVKQAREQHRHKTDNILDINNYYAILEELIQNLWENE